jgi:hypothetical protein
VTVVIAVLALATVAQPQPIPATTIIAASVVVADREPYAMYEATDVSTTLARLRGPLLLEIGEMFVVRMRRGEVVVEIGAKVLDVVRGDGHRDSEMVVGFSAGDASKLQPLVD